MDFIKALKTANNKSKRRAGTRKYINHGELYFSRLMGYRLIDGVYHPDDRCSKAILTIFDMLASGSTLAEIKTRLDELKERDSSNNRYSISKIADLGGRVIYSGYLQRGLRLIKIKNMIPIISLEKYRLAQKQLKKEERKFQ